MVFIFQPYAPNLNMSESRSATKKTAGETKQVPTTTPTAVNCCFPSDPEQSRTKHRFISNAPGLGSKNMETLLLQVSGIFFFRPPDVKQNGKMTLLENTGKMRLDEIGMHVFSMCFQCLDANHC